MINKKEEGAIIDELVMEGRYATEHRLMSDNSQDNLMDYICELIDLRAWECGLKDREDK